MKKVLSTNYAVVIFDFSKLSNAPSSFFPRVELIDLIRNLLFEVLTNYR
jgi:hypothetical protein